jgi:hypothetical protein
MALGPVLPRPDGGAYTVRVEGDQVQKRKDEGDDANGEGRV